MSDDIVERLDKRADLLRRYYPAMDALVKDVEAAADEIERLREQLDREAKDCLDCADMLSEKDAEIERLRSQAADDIIWMSGIGTIPEEGQRVWGEIQDRWLR